MERYSHIQNMPNSPFTPLTPLSENPTFDFNFGGDGSLDFYIERVRQEHRVEQQQKKLLQLANKTFHKPGCPMQPKRYTEDFLKRREVFESHDEHDNCTMILKAAPKKYCAHKQHESQMCVEPPKPPVVKITHSNATPTTSTQKTPTPTIQKSTQNIPDYVTTPTNVRTPLKHRNNNLLNIPSKSYRAQSQQKIQQKSHYQQQQQHRNQAFRKASPVAAKPLCPRLANILTKSGLSVYCGLFQREEIDLYTFQLLNLQDLHQMGITNPKHCELIMADIYYVEKYF